MSIIGGSGIIPSGGGIAPPPSGSGGVIEPSIQSGLTFAGINPLLTFRLVNNDPLNPSALDLSFSDSILKAVDGTFDQGDAYSPSYVLEGGEYRDVTFERGSGAPSYGNPNLSCTISALLADGNTTTSVVTVEPALLVSGIFSSYSPLLMVDYSSLNNDGSLKDTPLYVGGSTYPTYTTDLTRTSSTDVNGLVGYIETGTAGASFGGRAGFPNTSTANVLSNSTVNANGGFHSLRGQRTQIYIFETGSTITSTTISYTGNPNLLPFLLEFSGTSFGSSYLKGRYAAPGSSTSSRNYNSGDHTVLGVGNADPATLEMNTLYLYAVSYDETTETLTHRWKKTGDGEGFSYQTYQKDPGDGPTSNTYNVYCMINGKSGFSSAARPVKHRFHGLSHSLISDTDFNNIATLIGL